MDVVLLPIGNAMGHLLVTQITLGKASCFVFYMHWRNYVLCDCNISRSTHSKQTNYFFFSKLSSDLGLIMSYDEWLQHVCHLFTHLQTWDLCYNEANGTSIKKTCFMFMKPNTTMKMLWRLVAWFES
jgi:hypothetical protein